VTDRAGRLPGAGTRLLCAAAALACLAAPAAHATHEAWVKHDYPQDQQKWWWDDAWWSDGRMPVPANLKVVTRSLVYRNGEVEIPAVLYRPDDGKKYPGVLFQHGRRGVDDITALHPRRLAAQGFVVLAPDLFLARFIDKYPIAHDPVLEKDVARGIEFLLTLPDVGSKRVCTVSHTRGGYYTLKALVTEGKQEREVACYVSYYPHMQDPNLSEPMQVYRYAPEADRLAVPALIFFGEHEQYQRYRPIMEAVKSLRDQGRDVRLIVYPGVGRGFDFRPPDVRTFADDLAARDAMMRTAQFLHQHLED